METTSSMVSSRNPLPLSGSCEMTSPCSTSSLFSSVRSDVVDLVVGLAQTFGSAGRAQGA